LLINLRVLVNFKEICFKRENIMPALTKEQLNEFLMKGNLIAKLATLKEDGAPYVNPVWYEYDGQYIYIIGRARAQFVHNIRKDPRVAVCIDTPTPPHTRVLIEGKAEIIDKDWVEMGYRMARRYRGEVEGPKYIEKTLNRPRAMIRISPEKITSWTGPEWHRRYFDPE
jgi:PPOX class probable F420-dependent enzyme